MSTFSRLDMTLHASSEMTGGAFELIEDTRPAGSGPVPHIHRGFQEAFYVLEGRFTFIRGQQELDRRPGGFVLIPPETRHAYRAEEDGSRVLILAVPSGLADFLNEMGKLLAAGTSPAAAMAELSDRYDSIPVD